MLHTVQRKTLCNWNELVKFFPFLAQHEEQTSATKVAGVYSMFKDTAALWTFKHKNRFS